MKLNSVVPAVFTIGLMPLVTLAQTYYSPEQCNTFLLLDFDLRDYDNYEKFFNEDSYILYAATGTYTGLAGIEEYVRFADESSPYVESIEKIDREVNVTRFDPVKGICKFTIYSTEHSVMSKEFTNGDTIGYVVMLGLDYSIPKNIVTAMNLYYPTKFVEGFFTRLVTAPVFDFVCNTLTSPSCQNEFVLPSCSNTATLSQKQCVQRLSELPLFEEAGYLDSNTQGCRMLHSVFAATNPSHCAHVSLDRLEDRNGAIMCQDSEGVPIFSLFSTKEFAYLDKLCKNSPSVDESCIRVIKNVNPVTNQPTTSKSSKIEKSKKTKKS